MMRRFITLENRTEDMQKFILFVKIRCIYSLAPQSTIIANHAETEITIHHEPNNMFMNDNGIVFYFIKFYRYFSSLCVFIYAIYYPQTDLKQRQKVNKKYYIIKLNFEVV